MIPALLATAALVALPVGWTDVELARTIDLEDPTDPDVCAGLAPFVAPMRGICGAVLSRCLVLSLIAPCHID